MMTRPQGLLRCATSAVLLLLVTAGGAAAAQGRAARSVSDNFHVQQIAGGVYAVIRDDPPGFAVESNSVFIVCADDVIVVDAQSNVATTKAVLAALRKLTPKPVRYVINTHWHDDHIIGNQVYRDAFPNVEFIAHASTRAYLPTTGMTNRNKFHEGIPGFLALLRNSIKTNKNIQGEPLSDEERASYLSDLALGAGYMTVPPGYEPLLPTITLTEQLTLYHGGRAIEIKQVGRGHTAGDLVVYLPQEHIVAAGDLVVWPVPLIGAEQSHINDWAVSLDKLRALQPALIVPGHGPIMRDDSYVQLVARLMISVQQQTAAAVARGETLAQTRKSVNLDEFRRLLAGDSKIRNALFSTYVVGPAVAAAFTEASAPH